MNMNDSMDNSVQSLVQGSSIDSGLGLMPFRVCRMKERKITGSHTNETVAFEFGYKTLIFLV
jgi:hypothetical protein